MFCRQLSETEIAVFTASADETARLGTIIGERAYLGLTVLMYGGLGAGKTLLTKNIGAALGYKRIKSPTFIIVAEHNGGRLPLVHADLYRLPNYSEVDSLDLEQYIDQRDVLIIEWAERWENPPIEDYISIHFNIPEADAESREMILASHGEKAKGLLKQIKDEIIAGQVI
ncbi:MAG: tRNA (adenosine(37)-N6)-threonylcarbamoyltransferase complex ATPase subunit type 1 TsaE [Synergistaceae bacterium]|nr:tRNA (adenosine(37)-N6)-threonylcarbamoyltransferase complex ATPase subunit type 1 TsaE [Synergistaceae bacterium]